MPDLLFTQHPTTVLKVKKTGTDLRDSISEMKLAPRSQGGRPTCSVFASTFLLEYMTSKERGLVGLDLSEEYLNYAADMGTGASQKSPGDGDFFDAIAVGYEQFGIIDETWLPYRATFDPNAGPDAELQDLGKAARFFRSHVEVSPKAEKIGLSDAQLTTIREQLDAGVPVATGFHGSSSTTTVEFDDGVIAMHDEPAPTQDEYAHSVALVGYVASPILAGGGGYFIYRNSGGPDWGDHGYGYYTFDFARKWVYDFVYYRRPSHLPKFEINVAKVARPKLRFATPKDMAVLGAKVRRR